MSAFKVSALVLTILFVSFFTIFQNANAQSTILKGTTLDTNTPFAIPDENATIILKKGASYGDTTAYCPAHNSSDGYWLPSFWNFAVFSTGNGTTGLTISAHDCNVTIISYSYYLTDLGNYYVKWDSWLNYSVTGIGTQRLLYHTLENSNNSSPDVYIDGTAREQGNGWNWTNLGMSVSGAISTVSIHQEDTDHFLPRNPPHFEPIDYLLPISVIVTVIIVLFALLFRRHQKTANSKK